MKSLKVAIDTSIFENAHYAFDGHDLGILKKHVDDGKIEGLLVSDIVIEEAKSHFYKNAETLKDKVNTLIRGREYKLLESTRSIKKLGLTPIDARKMAEEQFVLFAKYLKAVHTTKLNSDHVRIKEILTDYFNNNPPFGGADKKHEFPDAIIIARLKEEVKKHGEIAVVSADGDWKNALANCAGVKFFEDLKQLFDFITRQEELDKVLAKKVIEFYIANYAEINCEIEGILRDKTYEVNGVSCDRHGIFDGYDYTNSELLNIVVKSQPNNIDHIRDDEVVATIKATANLEFNCEFVDEGDSIWDSEDKCYIYKKYGLMNEGHEIEFYVSIKYKIENGEVAGYSLLDVDLGNIVVLDQFTLIDRSYIEPEDLWEKRSWYRCPRCKHEISINLMGISELVSGSERSMGAELEHSVSYEDECPNCGKKYKISGSIWEYPVGTLNLDDTKIEWEE